MAKNCVFDMSEEEYAEWFEDKNGYTLSEQVEFNEAFENDLYTLKARMEDIKYAKSIYGALCNMRWKKDGSKPLYSCSWRYAGGTVAYIRDVGEDYMDFYCSGGEGLVSDEVKKALGELGWSPVPWEVD